MDDTQDYGGQQWMKSLKQGGKCEASPTGFLKATKKEKYQEQVCKILTPWVCDGDLEPYKDRNADCQ